MDFNLLFDIFLKSLKFFFSDERPTLFSDIWALAAVIVQWLLETPPWDFQELCARYKYRENKHVINDKF